MDREELMKLIKTGAVQLKMNNGDVFDIPSSEFAIVSDLHVHLLYRADDGRLRANILSLVCICSAESMEPAE